MTKQTKILNPGTKAGQVYVKLEFDGRKLSITGVDDPWKTGNFGGSCGQIVDTVRDLDRLNPPWTREMVAELCDIWDRWHLNDMRPGCEHQRDWDTAKPIALKHYTWSDRFHQWRKSAKDGSMSVDQYAQWGDITRQVYSATINHPRPQYDSELVQSLLSDGWIRLEKESTSTAGWVRPEEHPDGLLTKPCPVCGYKYGSEWRFEEVPQSVLDRLFSFPESTRVPAWG